MWWLVFIIAPVAIAVVIGIAYLSRAKCPQCKSRSRELIDSELVDQTSISIKKQVEDTVHDYDTYSKGITKPEKVIKRTVYVPGTRYTYHNTYKCKKCGHEYTVEEYKEKED